MARLDPDLENFSVSISKTAVNFKLQMCYSHISETIKFSEATWQDYLKFKLTVGGNGPIQGL